MWGDLPDRVPEKQALPKTTRTAAEPEKFATNASAQMPVRVLPSGICTASNPPPHHPQWLSLLLSNPRVEFQSCQRDDPALTDESKAQLALALQRDDPARFLHRFGRFLPRQEIVKMVEQWEGTVVTKDEVRFRLEELGVSGKGEKADRATINNRRYASLQKLLSLSDDHFSMASMRQRNPLLYQELIGDHLTEEEKLAEEREGASRADCTLSGIILEHIDLDRRREFQKAQKDRVDQEEFDSDDDDTSEQQPKPPSGNPNLSEEERTELRQEFIRTMHQLFLDGKDPDFDYSKVDLDPECDDLDQLDRDAEEKYFDED